MPFKKRWDIQVVLPLEENQAPEQNEAYMAILNLVKDDQVIGRDGHYSGVFMSVRGQGGYMAEDGAKPSVGPIGQPQQGPCVIFYAEASGDTPESLVDQFCEAVANLHPYKESPTIRVDLVRFWERAPDVK